MKLWWIPLLKSKNREYVKLIVWEKINDYDSHLISRSLSFILKIKIVNSKEYKGISLTFLSFLLRNPRSCSYFHDHHASDNNWSRTIITINTETHVKQKFFNFKNTHLFTSLLFPVGPLCICHIARSLSTRLLSRHFENSSFLSTWRSCALNARISKQSVSTLSQNFSTARPTYARESVARFFFFSSFFPKRKKKKKKRISTNFDRSRRATNFALLDSIYVIISITPRKMLLQHRNSMLFDRFIALWLLDSCKKKGKRKKEERRIEPPLIDFVDAML